ncbi:molybdopterin molybdotransferase MoeA [Catalinimonas niigatensis]|uniref:molybdopterin molybdotransferase MoeA n=1 Tax=Catalinimonas niigatensis TaxID=1397264 RepID=UPI002665747F|nr:molybdopterin molybdotransferase MoeA [Catalinimonas niigatensis]WPP52698.1 molybdopterin molybdotransferase MoeA [Catalinimonas niigatensis]
MIDVQQAYDIVMQHTLNPKAEILPLEKCQGKVLQEAIYADRDFPPFDRVTMDGIAYRFDALQNGTLLLVESMQVAGIPPHTLHDKQACIEVMTGAVTPIHTDTVTRYEDVEFIKKDGKKYARFLELPKKKGQNIHRQGLDEKEGTELLKPGLIIGPAEIAVAASVGKSQLKVSQSLSVGIVSTGDELVGIEEQPAPYQIRRSNSYALYAALQQMQITASIYHWEDEKLVIQQGLSEALEKHDVLIMSGGVSKGKKDFVPEVLEALGVHKLFHRVKQKPGKPFWFGKSTADKVVFALPGNPVSTFMCFQRYVKPWLLVGMGNKEEAVHYAELAGEISFPPPLTYFMQVKLKNADNGKLLAYPEEGQGSGDFANLLACDAFIQLPPEKEIFQAGEVYPILIYR